MKSLRKFKMFITKNSDVIDKNYGHIRIQQSQNNPKSFLLLKNIKWCVQQCYSFSAMILFRSIVVCEESLHCKPEITPNSSHLVIPSKTENLKMRHDEHKN